MLFWFLYGRTWGLSQKTSVLSGVIQILVYLRLSPCLADVGLFVRHPTQQTSLEQRVSLLSHPSSHLKHHMLHRDYNSSPRRRRTRLTWSTNCAEGGHALREGQIAAYYSSSPRGGQARLTWSRSTAAKFSRLQLASQTSIVSFAPWGIELHWHTRLSPGHGSDTACKDLGHHPKRLGSRRSCSNSYISKIIPISSDVELFVRHPTQ